MNPQRRRGRWSVGAVHTKGRREKEEMEGIKDFGSFPVMN